MRGAWKALRLFILCLLLPRILDQLEELIDGYPYVGHMQDPRFDDQLVVKGPRVRSIACSYWRSPLAPPAPPNSIERR